MSWTQIATPHGPETRLRVECQSEPGKHGRYKLTAFDGDKAVHSAVYAWNVWMGHACGQLLMPEFIQRAVKPCPSGRGYKAQALFGTAIKAIIVTP